MQPLYSSKSQRSPKQLERSGDPYINLPNEVRACRGEVGGVRGTFRVPGADRGVGEGRGRHVGSSPPCLIMWFKDRQPVPIGILVLEYGRYSVI